MELRQHIAAEMAEGLAKMGESNAGVRRRCGAAARGVRRPHLDVAGEPVCVSMYSCPHPMAAAGVNVHASAHAHKRVWSRSFLRRPPPRPSCHACSRCPGPPASRATLQGLGA